ncbi:transglutaminase-like domain-containing protein [Jatrophihabitans sp. DSM 45814]
MTATPARQVTSHLTVEIQTPARLVLQLAVARIDPLQVAERLVLAVDGKPMTAQEVAAPHGGRWHVLDAPVGRLTVDYSATLLGRAAIPDNEPADEIRYLHPSRYAESDRLFALARQEFAGIPPGRDLLSAVSSWVGTRLSYLSGSSRPTDGALDTLLAGQGVCRDFAHLVVALLRALDVPARMVAVYAPGLDPMDFHAVAEARIGGRWLVVDATLLAPRSSLVRIATGLDATETAFLSSYHGDIQMVDQWVSATVDGDLPTDDITDLVQLG